MKKAKKNIITVDYKIGKPLLFRRDKDGHIDAIYPSHDFYETHAETYTGISTSEAENALRLQLPSVLPGNYNDYIVDIKTKRLKEKKIRAVAVIIRQKNLEEIRSEYPNAPLYIPVALALLINLEGSFQIYRKEKTDSFLITPDTAIYKSLSMGEKLFPEDIEDFSNSLFFKKNNWTKQRKIFYGLAGASILLLACFIGTSLRVQSLNNQWENLDKQWHSRMNDIKKIETITQETIDEKVKLESLLQLAPTPPYPLLSGLEQTLPKGTIIETITISGGIFSIRGTTPNALILVEKMEESILFDHNKLGHISTLPHQNRERFSLTGIFYGR